MALSGEAPARVDVPQVPTQVAQLPDRGQPPAVNAPRIATDLDAIKQELTELVREGVISGLSSGDSRGSGWSAIEIVRESRDGDDSSPVDAMVQDDDVSWTIPEYGPVLPGSSPWTIVGTMQLGDGPDLFAFHPESDDYALTFTSSNASSDLADNIVILDCNQEVIANCSLTRTENSLTIRIQSDRSASGSDQMIYVKIGPPARSQSQAQDGYALTVQPMSAPGGSEGSSDFSPAPRDETTSTTTGPSNLGQGSLPGPVVIVSPANPYVSGIPSAITTTATTTTSTSSRSEADSLAAPSEEDGLSGSLPARSAAPFGGILSFGEPAPTVGSHEAAVVDLALVDLPTSVEVQDGADEMLLMLASDASTDLVLLDNAGNLPQLAAAYPNATIDPLPPELVNPATQSAEASALVDGRLADAILNAGEPVTVVAIQGAVPSTSQRVLRMTVAGLTALMAAHLLIPDVGVFLPFVRPRRRRRWRNLFSSWASRDPDEADED